MPDDDVVGRWEEREVIDNEGGKIIEEWQSCRCSICKRYDTRPYLYYFSSPRYCSYCGHRMEGENDEVD